MVYLLYTLRRAAPFVHEVGDDSNETEGYQRDLHGFYFGGTVDRHVTAEYFLKTTGLDDPGFDLDVVLRIFCSSKRPDWSSGFIHSHHQ